MPKIMHINVTVELPADEFDEAAAKMVIKPLWDTFILALGSQAGIAVTSKLETCETRAKRADIGKPRARKPAADRPPRLVPPPQDAA